MSELQFVPTAAGRAALVNAENTGTLPVLVAAIGVTDQAFTATKNTSAIPGEIKRLATFSGDAVANDTIHVVVRDFDPVVYSMRGFGLYLADGTLFGSYGQADVIVEKSAQSTMLMAADIIFEDINAAEISFGDTNWLNPPATTTTPGVMELATPAEGLAGTDPARAVPPSVLKYVLNQRFGADAPSAFIKPLLGLATAALVRTSLELGNASLRNTGAGNGLDADLLDGKHGAYYLAWENLEGKPPLFPPSSHTHDWAEITGAPSTATRWPTWSEVTGKPSTFAPSSHTHAWGDIVSGLPAYATRWPTWSEVTSKPASYPPSTHPHDAGDITSGKLAYGRIPHVSGNESSGYARFSQDGDNPDVGGSLRILTGGASLRYYFDGSSVWGVDSSGVMISGSVPWARLTGVPTTFAPAAHTHAASDITSGTLADTRIPALAISKTAGLQDALDAKAPTNRPTFSGGYQCVNLGYADKYLSSTSVSTGFSGGAGSTWYWRCDPSGDSYAYGTSYAVNGFDTGSSRTVKELVAPIGDDALQSILAMEPVFYRYLPEYSRDDRVRAGLFAEDLQKIAPEAVKDNPEPMPPPGERYGWSPKHVEYPQLIPRLIKAMQQQQARIERLERLLEAR